LTRAAGGEGASGTGASFIRASALSSPTWQHRPSAWWHSTISAAPPGI